jgi:hypothetical protein
MRSAIRARPSARPPRSTTTCGCSLRASAGPTAGTVVARWCGRPPRSSPASCRSWGAGRASCSGSTCRSSRPRRSVTSMPGRRWTSSARPARSRRPRQRRRPEVRPFARHAAPSRLVWTPRPSRRRSSRCGARGSAGCSRLGAPCRSTTSTRHRWPARRRCASSWIASRSAAKTSASASPIRSKRPTAKGEAPPGCSRWAARRPGATGCCCSPSASSVVSAGSCTRIPSHGSSPSTTRSAHVRRATASAT